MKLFTKLKWRRVGVLSATFILALFVTSSCKKEQTGIGQNQIDQDALLNGQKVDTFSLFSYNYLEDSLSTENPALSVLGSYHDPVFGKVDASFYTQIRLASSNPNFGDTSSIILDSFVLALRYSGYQGGLDEQTFEVYELDEAIESSSDVTYYEFSELNVKSQNIIDPSRATFKPNPTASVLIDTALSLPQMRLHLDTNIAKNFINEASVGTSFSSNDNFLNYFKGLKIKTNNPSQAKGEGGVFYFNTIDGNSKLTIFYRQLELVNGELKMVKKRYDLVMNTACEDFNHFERDFTGTKVADVLADKSQGQFEFYAQAFGLRSMIEIPSLKEIPSNVIIHKAELFFPVQQHIGSKYQNSSSITVATKTHVDSLQLQLVNVASYSEFTSGYTFSIQNYVQEVISGRINNVGIILSPRNLINSAERITFNGPNTDNKLKPKLSIIYTEF
jgi:hypothetical protein